MAGAIGGVISAGYLVRKATDEQALGKALTPPRGPPAAKPGPRRRKMRRSKAS